MSPATCANSWSWATANSWGDRPSAITTTTSGQHTVTTTSDGGDRGDRPEQVAVQRRRALAGEAGDQHAAGDAAVEQQRQGDVTAGAPALADHLDDDGADHRDDDGGERRGGAGEQAQGDAGDGDVADAVTHQREPALHEVGADGRGGEPGEQGAEQRPDHEVVGQQAHRRPRGPGRSSGEATVGAWSRSPPVEVSWWWSWVRSASVNAAIGGPSYATRPSRITSARSTSGAERAELVGDQHDGGAAVDEGLQRVGEGLLALHVDPGGGLVEDEQVGYAGQGAGDQHPLLLAAGEGGDAVAGLVGEADRGDRASRRRRGPRGSAAGTAGAARAGRRRRPRARRRVRRTRR